MLLCISSSRRFFFSYSHPRKLESLQFVGQLLAKLSQTSATKEFEKRTRSAFGSIKCFAIVYSFFSRNLATLLSLGVFYSQLLCQLQRLLTNKRLLVPFMSGSLNATQVRFKHTLENICAKCADSLFVFKYLFLKAF